MKLMTAALLFATFVSFAMNAKAQCPVPNLPRNFTITERVLSLTNSFKMTSQDGNLGDIVEKIFTLTRTFDYTDTRGRRIATAEERFLTWGTHVDVFDCTGHKIGGLKEQVLKSLFKVQTVYSILDASDRVVATSEKVDWISTSFTLRNPHGDIVAHLDRPWVNLIADKWNVTVIVPGAVDPRILVMIGAYKTAVDNDRRSAN